MSRFIALVPAVVLLAAGFVLWASSQSGVGQAVTAEAAASASRKLDGILNPSISSSRSITTRFTEQEVNSYIHYDLASEYPPGISKVNLNFVPGSISGSADVDFDKLKSARSSGTGGGEGLGMLSYLFRGVHTINCEGAFSAVNGLGRFSLGEVSIDGLVLPRPLVDFLVASYLKPRFPALNLDHPFRLPDSIDAAEVGQGSLQVKTVAH